MLFDLVVFAAAAGLLLVLLNWYINGNDDYWPKLGVVFVHGRELGSFWDRISFKIPLHDMDNTAYKLVRAADPKAQMGGIMELRRPLPLVVHPDLVKHVMVKDFEHFPNRRLIGTKNDPTLFDINLFSIDYPEWKELRATMTPTFTIGKIKRMFSVIANTSENMVNFLREEGKKSTEFDLMDAMGRFTMDIIFATSFGVDSQNFKDKNSVFAQMGARVQTQFMGAFSIFKVFFSIFLPSAYRLFPFSILDQISFDFLKDVVLRTIRHREASGETRNDFLQLLMDTRKPGSTTNENEGDDVMGTGQPRGVRMRLSDELIVAQCHFFFIGSVDTTESALIFAAYELALNPDIQEKLAEELSICMDQNGGFSYESLNELEYLDMIVSETLRKYPPFVRIERLCTKDFLVAEMNVTIRKGQTVVVPAWAIHHDPEHYPEPEKFIPERFTKENKASRNPYTYMPFSVGPRSCIAMRFALTEVKAAIAHLVHNFVIEPCSRTLIPMEYTTDGSLKPVGGMWLKVTPRSS